MIKSAETYNWRGKLGEIALVPKFNINNANMTMKYNYRSGSILKRNVMRSNFNRSEGNMIIDSKGKLFGKVSIIDILI